MNDTVTVKVLQCDDHLHKVALDFDFGKSLTSFDQFVEGLSNSNCEGVDEDGMEYLIGTHFK